MELQGKALVIIPEEELTGIQQTLEEILKQLSEIRNQKGQSRSLSEHITAKEFMAAVRICRSKFDQLVLTNKIKTIKKKRKIYLPASEIERYFTDPNIQ